jgi:hypothetical protein
MIKQFKSILNDDDILNKETVGDYLEQSFKRRRAKKDFELYINICKIYDKYPSTIEELLNNIPTLGYYKDYFYILMFSRNKALDKYILDIIIKQVNEDLQNIKDKRVISTLGKWLPRENCKINKKINFIDTFNQVFYPNVPQLTARKRYRKLKSMLNKEIGTIEAKMCTNQYQGIDFSKVSPVALKRNRNAILRNEEGKLALEKYELDELKKKDLHSFIREVTTNIYSINTLQDVWDHNRYCMEIPYIDKIIGKSTCFIDLSKDSFSTNLYYHGIGMALLVNDFSNTEHKVFVGDSQLIKLDGCGNVVDKVNHLLTLCGPCKFDLEKISNITSQTYIFVTNKEINYEYFNNKKITILHFSKQEHDKYEITYYNGDKIKKLTRYDDKLSRNVIKYQKEGKKNINIIVNESCEINDYEFPLRVIALLFSIWIFLQLFNIVNNF